MSKIYSNHNKIMNNTLHTPAPWEHSAENAEIIAQEFLATAAALGSAIKWMSENAYRCEQAKLNPDIVDVITGDSALDVLCALRGFAMALDRATI